MQKAGMALVKELKSKVATPNHTTNANTDDEGTQFQVFISFLYIYSDKQKAKLKVIKNHTNTHTNEKGRNRIFIDKRNE